MTTMARGVFRSLRKERDAPTGEGKRRPLRKQSSPSPMPTTPGLSTALRREKAARPPMISTPSVQLVRLKASRASAP